MSLDILEYTTKDLGQKLRDFESATCPAFETRELKRETQARQRRQTKVATAQNAASTSEITDDVPPSPRRPSTFMGPPHLSIDKTIQSQADPRPDPSTSSIASMILTTGSAPMTIAAAEAGPRKFKSHVDGKTPLQRHIKQKKFNLKTYKTHSLGDYVQTIRMYGTTDSYSTEPVSSFYLSAIGYRD
jgi:hypothetical protein